MRTVAIIGGRLQGTEAVYLAKKAGMRSILIDKCAGTPASGFCDIQAVFDVRRKDPELIALLKTADFILPALENDEVLSEIVEIARSHNLKLAFDPKAYKITESKLKSDWLIGNGGIPAPEYFPDCKAPYIIKPSGESGSAGVQKVKSAKEVHAFLESVSDPEAWVVQEYLEGRSYSIEVVGIPGNYRTYAITEIHMDGVYDCKMVTCPCDEIAGYGDQLSESAKKLANLVVLHGIMDVEVIDDDGILKVLEIDARIPSQTPTAVLHATGINLLAELADIVCDGVFQERIVKPIQHTAYEHYLIDAEGVHSHGEHIMGEAGPLTLRENFFDADEVISDYVPKAAVWRGIFINTADTAALLEKKREKMRNALGTVGK